MIHRYEKKRTRAVVNRSGDRNCKAHEILYFDKGIFECIQWLNETKPTWHSRASRNENHTSESWDLNAGWDGAETLMRDGWSEGAAMIDAKLQAIMPATGRQARWGYDVRGGSVNVNRFLTGHPRSMRSRTKRTMGSAPVLHICVNIACSSAVNASHMANYGTALVGLIDRLENSNRRVHLDVMDVTYMENGQARFSTGWNVKKANEPVDLSAIAYSIAHPAALRRTVFAMNERMRPQHEEGGYGQPMGIDIIDVPDANEGMMLLNGIQHDYRRCNSERDALLFAIEQLNEAAVVAGHATLDDPLINVDDAMEIIAA